LEDGALKGLPVPHSEDQCDLSSINKGSRWIRIERFGAVVYDEFAVLFGDDGCLADMLPTLYRSAEQWA